MIRIHFRMSQSHGTENGKENECLLQLWINYRIQLSVSIFPLFSKNQWLLTSHGTIILESIGTLKHFLLFICICACSACVCLLMFAVYGNTCTYAHTEARDQCFMSSFTPLYHAYWDRVSHLIWLSRFLLDSPLFTSWVVELQGYPDAH